MTNSSQSYMEKAQSWANNSAFDRESRQEIQELIDHDQRTELKERFYKDLEFGTGGMRAILGQGTNRLNKYNIRKASHAMAKTILETFKVDPREKRVAISYDSRHYSFDFAKEAACVFAANGITALIYQRLNPVALCSFAIRYHNCMGGVMVTASHNPPEYNGFKVFWEDGAQVTPPNDQNIFYHFNALLDYSTIPYLEFDQGLSQGLIKWLTHDDERLYFEAIKNISLRVDENLKWGSELKIVYTALHGTGYTPCIQALRDLGFTTVYSVKEQEKPDPHFPTVSSPNPENPEALALGVQLMKDVDADLCLGTDPDTDRVGVAYLHEGETKYLNGNQIGLLMLYYLLETHREKETLPPKPYFVKTIVTSDLQSKIAQSHGVTVENTLTGFKWICGLVNKIEKEQPERNFIFGTEESFGYLNHAFVRDKDGVSSIALMAELTLYFKRKGLNLSETLDTIYDQYGFSHESLLSLNYKGIEGAEKIQRIMEHFRKYQDSSFFNQEVGNLIDYKSLTIKDFKEKTLKNFSFHPSDVLGFTFTSGNKVFLRPSGTEPKIKFYIMIHETAGSLADKKEKAFKLASQLEEFIKKQVENL